jgi:glycosyltransferase involved in cell wall biosynthesis
MLKDYEANIYFVCDDDDEAEIKAVENAAYEHPNVRLVISDRGRSYAQKVNSGYKQTSEPWIFICGDDVAATPGWIEAARRLSDRFDVIGTNDSEPGVTRNPDVAAGRHADHFFVRRSYVAEYGAALDGPGVAAPEAYKHWWVDREIVGLAKARGVFTPCLDSVVIHNHPGYDDKPRDEVYQLAIGWSEQDQKTFNERAPLIEMQRTSYAKVR